jgi:hypothetical protein
MTVKIFALLVSLTAGIAVSAQVDELAQDAALASGNAATPSYFIAFDALPPLKEVGRSSLRVMVFKVFDSALFTESGEWQDPTKSFRYELTYARTIAGAVLASQTTKEWEHLGFTDERQSGWVEYLEAIWPDVSKGDTITFDVDAAGVSRFYFNGEWLGAIEGPDFAPLFIAIWLSPETSRPAHREGLLADSQA